MIADAIDCTIERRLLVNYRISPEYVTALLPEPFRPQIVSGHAVGGVCFIRLGQTRPARLPKSFGLTTENVAHRFAVEWEDDLGTHVGVYIPRRDTDSRLTSALGGKIFPGSYHLARFGVEEEGEKVSVAVSSRDGRVRLAAQAVSSDSLRSKLFGSLDEAVGFFRNGAMGYSPDASGSCAEGVRLEGATWRARPMRIERMESSVFDDMALFPPGTCTLDSALVMRDLPVRWVTDGAIVLAGRAA
jgi:hypothetical protein